MSSHNDISTIDSDCLYLLKKGPNAYLEDFPYTFKNSISNIEHILSLCEFSSFLIQKSDISYLQWYERKKNFLDFSDPVIRGLILFCHAYTCYHLEKDYYAYFYSLLASSFFRKHELWIWYLYLKKLDFLVAQRNGYEKLFLHKLVSKLGEIPLPEQIPFIRLYLYFFRKYQIDYFLIHSLKILQIQPEILNEKVVRNALLKSFIEGRIPSEVVQEYQSLLLPLYQKGRKLRQILKKKFPDYNFNYAYHNSLEQESEIADYAYFNFHVNKIIQQKCYNSYRHPNKRKWLEGVFKMEEQKKSYEAHFARLKSEIEQTRSFLRSFTSWYLPDTHYVTATGSIFYAEEEIGGDFLSAEEFSDEDFLLFIGDTTGKGLYAALIVATIKAFLKTRAQELNPLSILGELSFLIQNLHIEGLYMASAILKIQQNQVHLYGAGLPSALLYRANSHTIEKIDLSGLWLGTPFMIPKPYSIHQISLRKDDVLMIFTDGILSYDPASGFQIVENIFSDIIKVYHSKPIREINNIIGDQIADYLKKKHKGKRKDDFTYVLIKGLK